MALRGFFVIVSGKNVFLFIKFRKCEIPLLEPARAMVRRLTQKVSFFVYKDSI